MNTRRVSGWLIASAALLLAGIAVGIAAPLRARPAPVREATPLSTWPVSLGPGGFAAAAVSPDGVVAIGQGDPPVIVGLSRYGTALWTTTVNSADADSLSAVALTSTGDIVAVGAKNYTDSVILLYDASGALLWKQACPSTTIKAVTVTRDDDIVGVGSVRSGNSYADAWLIMLSSTGDQLATRTLGGSYQDGFTTVTATPDGGVVAAGVTDSTDGDFLAAGLVAGTAGMAAGFTADGTLTWVTRFDGTRPVSAITGSAPAPDGSVVIVGATRTAAMNQTDGLVIAVLASGARAWAKTYGTPDSNSFNAVTVADDNTVVAVGQCAHVGADGTTSQQGVAVRLNPSHELDWARTYGDDGKSLFASIGRAPDGTMILAGGALYHMSLSGNLLH